jgi:hypothetical protein
MTAKTLMNNKASQTLNPRMTQAAMLRAMKQCLEASPQLYARVEAEFAETVSKDVTGVYNMSHLDHTFAMRCEVWVEGTWTIERLTTPLPPPDESDSEEEATNKDDRGGDRTNIGSAEHDENVQESLENEAADSSSETESSDGGSEFEQ